MDDASKALVMAGAILIAIALVSLGVYLFNSASNTVTDASGQLDATKIETQNAKFEKYVGTNVKGPEVKALIRAIGTSNANDIFPEDIAVSINGGAMAVCTSDMANDIDDRLYYTVEMTDYDDDFGYLTQVTIDDN